jgi:hypothetical protein
MAEQKEVSCRTSVRDGSITPQAAKTSLKNNVSRLNSSAGSADEINNFRAPAIFSRKLSWPIECVILHLLRFVGCLAQLGSPANGQGPSRDESNGAAQRVERERGEPAIWLVLLVLARMPEESEARD